MSSSLNLVIVCVLGPGISFTGCNKYVRVISFGPARTHLALRVSYSWHMHGIVLLRHETGTDICVYIYICVCVCVCVCVSTHVSVNVLKSPHFSLFYKCYYKMCFLSYRLKRNLTMDVLGPLWVYSQAVSTDANSKNLKILWGKNTFILKNLPKKFLKNSFGIQIKGLMNSVTWMDLKLTHSIWEILKF